MTELTPPLDAEAGALLAEAVGTTEFDRLLLDTAQSICRIDELFGYIVLDNGEPETIVSSSVLPGYSKRVQLYVERFYRHDPAVRGLRYISPGESIAQRISLSSIIPHDYRRHCFSDPGFSEKLSFGWRGSGYLLVISFYRRDVGNEEVLRKLASLANFVIAIMVRHHAPIARANVVTVLERRLARSFPKLSERERQVCARTLAGCTAQAIASDFDISLGTVLTYRRRAYARYDVGGASAFLPKLLN